MVPIPIPLPARSQINGYLLKIWAFRSDDTAAAAPAPSSSVPIMARKHHHRISYRNFHRRPSPASVLLFLLALFFMAKMEALNKYGRTNGQSGSQFNLSNSQWWRVGV